MIKYPKTPRLAAVLQEDLATWRHLRAVVEEKVDGANVGISFEGGRLILQSRGHVLSGGPREALFAPMKPWAYEHQAALYEALGDRYVAFGEWCYAKNRLFYDALPAYFLEFDLFDKEEGWFLTTPQRRSLLAGSPLTSVAVLWEGPFGKAPAFGSFIAPSRYKTGRWKTAYRKAMKAGLDRHYQDSETDDSLLMEGVYVKVEDDQQVIGRMKLPRPEFEKVRTDDQKWLRRPLFPNQLAIV